MGRFNFTPLNRVMHLVNDSRGGTPLMVRYKPSKHKKARDLKAVSRSKKVDNVE